MTSLLAGLCATVLVCVAGLVGVNANVRTTEHEALDAKVIVATGGDWCGERNKDCPKERPIPQPKPGNGTKPPANSTKPCDCKPHEESAPLIIAKVEAEDGLLVKARVDDLVKVKVRI